MCPFVFLTGVCIGGQLAIRARYETFLTSLHGTWLRVSSFIIVVLALWLVFCIITIKVYSDIF